MKKLVVLMLSIISIMLLLLNGAVFAADWTCYTSNGDFFCSKSVLDLEIAGSGYSSAAQCAQFCSY